MSEPLLAWYLPAVQLAHGTFGSAVNVPFLQTFCAVAPVAQYEPAMQSSHFAAPPLAWYLPAVQAAHGTFGSAENLPFAHAVCAALPSGQCDPGLHFVGTMVPA